MQKMVETKSLLRGILVNESVILDDKNNKNAYWNDERIQKCKAQSLATVSLSDSFRTNDDMEDMDDLNNEFSDVELLRMAEAYEKEEKLVAAARLLRRVRNLAIMNRSHRLILQRGDALASVIDEHKIPTTTPNGWKMQSIHNGRFDAATYYKMVGSELSMRVESPMPRSLIVSMFAVLQQIEMWDTWMPFFNYPVKMGICDVQKYEKFGRFNLLFGAKMCLPLLGDRRLRVEFTISDCIAEDGVVVCKSRSVGEGGDNQYFGDLPPKNSEQIYFDMSITIRKCPPGHPALKKSRLHNEEELFLVTKTAFIQPSINIFTKTFCGPVFLTLLRIADEVRNGKRPKYTEAMKQEKYNFDWIEQHLTELTTRGK